MLKRALFLLILALSPFAAASAQAPSAEAEQIAQVFHANSAIAGTALEQTFAARSDEWRADLIGQPAFQALPPERRAAVLAVFATAPDVFREELAAATPVATQAFASEVDGIIPPQYRASIARFLTSPVGQVAIRTLIGFRSGDLREHARRAADPMTEADYRQLDRFLQWRPGRVLEINWMNLNIAFYLTAEAPFTGALAAAGRRMEEAYCTAMGPYCAPEPPAAP